MSSERGWEGVLSWLPWWRGRERGAGASQNPHHLPWVTRYLLPMLPLHDQGRGPWIFLHVVSGPWTSFVAALDKGKCRKAVCRRHTVFSKILDEPSFFVLQANLFVKKAPIVHVTAHSNSPADLRLILG